MPTVFENDVIARGFTLAELYAMSDEDRQRYQDELKHYRDALNMLQTARDEGLEAGREEGREEGRGEGREEGRGEGREEGLREALDRLVAGGIPVEQAKKLLGFE